MPSLSKNLGVWDVLEECEFVSDDGGFITVEASAGLDRILALIPDTRGNASGVFAGEPGRSVNTGPASTIAFRGHAADGRPIRYRFSTQVVVDPNKTVAFVNAGAITIGGAVLWNNTGDDHMIVVDAEASGAGAKAPGAFTSFAGLTMHEGGVKVAGEVRAFTVTDRMFFNESPGPAMYYVNGATTLGANRMFHYDNYYFRCWGGEWLEGVSTGIVGGSYGCFHQRTMDTAMKVDGSSYEIDSVKFQAMNQATGLTNPYLWIEDRIEATSNITIRDCRFGPETQNTPDEEGVTFGPASISLLIGHDQTSGRELSNIRIQDCQFYGRETGEFVAGLGEVAIEFRHRPVACSVRGCEFRNYITCLNQTWLNGGAMTGGSRLRNMWGTNNVDSTNDNLFNVGAATDSASDTGASAWDVWLMRKRGGARETVSTAVGHAWRNDHLYYMEVPPNNGGPANWVGRVDIP